MSKLFEDLALVKGDGRYHKLLTAYPKTDLLILDDSGLATPVTSQLPIKHWHEQIGDPTLADAILDLLIHAAHKRELDGESMRKKKAHLR